jgi:hypothetical protein
MQGECSTVVITAYPHVMDGTRFMIQLAGGSDDSDGLGLGHCCNEVLSLRRVESFCRNRHGQRLARCLESIFALRIAFGTSFTSDLSLSMVSHPRYG